MKKGGVKKRGQVWVETVIYTLIAFAMIGLVLSFVRPKIEESQDKAILGQTIRMFEDIDDVILTVREVPGNQRIVEIGIKKGELEIDGVNDEFIFEMESRYAYSQPGEDVDYGGIIANTKKTGKYNIVTLTKDYAQEYNLQYSGSEKSKKITKAAIPYKMFISNQGKGTGEDIRIIINMDVI